jgi:hypothetical protein
MSFTFNSKQKSLKRRFLFILGVITFIGFCILGLMVMFYDKMNLDFPDYQRKILGAMIMLYAVLRFSRLLKRDPNE